MTARRRPNPTNIAPLNAQDVAVILATIAGVCVYFSLIGVFLQPLGWIWAPLLLIIAAVSGVGALVLYYMAPGNDNGRSAGTAVPLHSSTTQNV